MPWNKMAFCLCKITTFCKIAKLAWYFLFCPVPSRIYLFERWRNTHTHTDRDREREAERERETPQMLAVARGESGDSQGFSAALPRGNQEPK